MKKLLITSLFLVFTSLSLFSQSVDEITQNNLDMLGAGKIGEVKAELIDLIAQYPNEPGIKFLIATVSKDAKASISMFQDIIKNYPTCVWVDDCYLKLIQYYVIISDLKKADETLNTMRETCPNSKLLFYAYDFLQVAEQLKIKVEENRLAIPKPSLEPIQTNQVAQKTEPTQEKIIEKQVPAKVDNKSIVSNKPTVNNKAEKIDSAKTNQILQTKNEDKTATVNDDPPIPTSDEKFGLQVAVFRDYSKAEAEQKVYIEKRIRSIITKKIVNGETMYSIVVGEYSTAERAEKAKRIVEKECNCKPLIVNK